MNKFKFYSILGLSGAFVTFVLWAWLIAIPGLTYAEGSRAGVVIKFSQRRDIAFSTWEGELAQGALETGGQREKWEFSVLADQTNPSGKKVVDLVQIALDHGRRTKLVYRQQRGLQSWKGATTYFITDVMTVE